MLTLTFALSLALQIPPGTAESVSEPVLDQAQFAQGTVAAVVDGSRTYVARSLGVVGLVGALAQPFVRTEALDAQGNVLWTRDIYDSAATSAPTSAPLARDLIHDAAGGRVIQGRTLDDQLLVEALDENTGQVIWSTALNVDPLLSADSVRRLAFDEDRNRVLAFTVESSVLELHSLDVTSGAVAWSTELEQVFGSALQDPEYAYSPATQELVVASKTGSGFLPVRVQRVDLATGAAVAINDQYSANFFDVAVSSDGQRIALALGRQPSARLAMLDAQSGSVQWFFKDEATVYDDLPNVEFEPDGAHLLAGYMSRGVQAIVTEPSGARFLRFRTSDGQIVWSNEQAGSSVPIVGTATGPQLLEVDAATHLRSFTLTQAGGQHVQRIERVLNADGSVTASLTEDGSGSGALHFEELGTDENGDHVAVLQLQAMGQAPSLSFPEFALGRWDFASGTTQIAAFDSFGFEGTLPAASIFDSENRRAALVTSGAVSGDFLLSVVDVDSGDLVQQLTLAKPPGTGSVMVRFSPDGKFAGVRTYSASFFANFPDRLWMIDLESGQVIWERDLPRGADALPEIPNDTEAGQSMLEFAGDRVYVTDAVADSTPIEHRLHCLDVATGAPIWQRDLGCYAVPTAVLSVTSDAVYAIGELDLGPVTSPTLLELSLDDGSVQSTIPLPAGECVMAIYAKQDAVGLLTRDPAVSASIPKRAWVYDRSDLSLLDTRVGGYFGLVPLAPSLGFAFYEFGRIDQLGVQLPGIAIQTPWSVDVDFGATAKLVPVDGGQALLRTAALLTTDLPQQVKVWDARTGAELWSAENFLPDAETLEFTGSAADEFHVWEQSQSTGATSGEAFASRLRTFAFPDVLVVPGELSLQTGGLARLELRGDLTMNLQDKALYAVLGGLATVSNGPTLGALQLPFDAADPFFLATLVPQPGTFIDFAGTLDPYGNATAQVSVPTGLDPALAGEDFYFAFAQFERFLVTQGSTVVWKYFLTDISDAAPLTLIP
jgi:outer membrane protein assembly factor BamB